MDREQLTAFAAVIELGSFDAAAQRLHVTPSAISQRIKASRTAGGAGAGGAAEAVRRDAGRGSAAAPGRPDRAAGGRSAGRDGRRQRPGRAGRGRGQRRLDGDLVRCRVRACRGGLVRRPDRGPGPLRAAAAGRNRDGRGHHRAHTGSGLPGDFVGGDALRAGRQPVLHRAASTQGFTARAAAVAPSLAWNRDDALQDMLLRKVFRRDISRPTHYVPTAEGFGAAVRAGLGWGMFPESLAALDIADGVFVRIYDAYLDVPLFWQCWKLDSPLVHAVTDAVRSAARALAHPFALACGSRRQFATQHLNLLLLNAIHRKPRVSARCRSRRRVACASIRTR